MKQKLMTGIYALMMLVGAGCASPATDHPIAASSSKSVVHAECLVCKKNADLACIDVEVDKTTPSYLFNGVTYHFCSDECHDKFVKDPAKYIGK